jgi:DNA invertase Pin-like site-specific DNA recombinase
MISLHRKTQKQKIGIYIRIGNENQIELEKQLDNCKKFIEENFLNYEIEGIYSDLNIPATKYLFGERKELSKLLEHSKQGLIDNIIVYSKDRLSRDVKELEFIYTLTESFNTSIYEVKNKIKLNINNNEMHKKLLEESIAEFEIVHSKKKKEI